MTNHGAKALAMAVSLLLGQASVVAAHPDKKPASVARPAAIVGGDTNAIIGGDMTGRQQLRIITRGPVDQVDTSTGRVEVLGQEFATPRSANLLQELSVRIASGEIVTATVYGSLRANGMPYPKSIVFSEDQQIPGVTIVTVLGMVQKIDHAHGTLVIGGLTVDYTPLLADGPADFSAGTVVEISGVRFSASGPLLASALQTH